MQVDTDMKDSLQTLARSAVPTGSLFEKSIKSGAWIGGIKIFSRIFNFLTIIILARLLTPEAFGLMGIALLSVAATKQFTNIGLNATLIQQKQQDIDEYLNTAWCLEIARGLLITSVLFIFAPFIARLLGEPSATTFIRVFGLGPLLFGFRNPGTVYFHKELAFHREFFYKTGGAVVQFAVSIAYAVVSPTVWALVCGFLAKDVFKLIISYFIHDYRPWPVFDTAAANELVGYGKWITATSVVTFLYSKGDDVFVGWFLSATMLGFYQYAYRIADMPSTQISETISTVTFPAYSKLQDDPEKLRTAVLNVMRVNAFITIPMGAGIAVITPDFVLAVLGPEWTPIIPTMQILAIYGALHSITRNFGSIWKALGRPDLDAKLGAFRTICVGTLIWPATAAWGIEGTAVAILGVVLVVGVPIDVYLTAQMTGIRSLNFYRIWAYPVFASIVMFVIVWWLAGFINQSPAVTLLFSIPIGVLLYFTVAFSLQRWFSWEIDDDLKKIARICGI